MPRSVVIYTSRDGFFELKAALARSFVGQGTKPYTLSHAQRIEAERVRLRITELADDTVFPLVVEQAGRQESTFASSGDRDVKGSGYEALIEDADRFGRTATIQLVSPTIVEVLRHSVPFPVVPSMFKRYVEVWNTFSRVSFPAESAEVIDVHVSDFRISCVSTKHGPGAQGWVTLEMDKGRTEEEIRRFNALVDFAFYSGTGLYADEGFGQTRRMEGKRK
jgi:hypothetical protein